MNNSLKRGFSFGLTSGIITTLGLIVGLDAGTHSAKVVISGILVIAFADALSDALGMHVSEESEYMHNAREIWISTIATFLAKLFFASIFIFPFLFFPLSLAINLSVILGLSLITYFSYHLATRQNIKPHRVIIEHLLIAIIVIISTHYIGDWAAKLK